MPSISIRLNAKEHEQLKEASAALGEKKTPFARGVTMGEVKRVLGIPPSHYLEQPEAIKKLLANQNPEPRR